MHSNMKLTAIQGLHYSAYGNLPDGSEQRNLRGYTAAIKDSAKQRSITK